MCDIKYMSGLRRHKLWLLSIVFIGVGAFAGAAYGAPTCTGPLNIHTPIYAGTKVVACENGTAGCPIYVYADGKLVGQGSKVTPVGYGVVYLSRALKTGETITAKQDPAGSPTWSQKAPKVEDVPVALLINRKFKPPSIVPPTVACQRGVKVEGLVEGVRASVSGGPVTPPKTSSSGSTWTPYDRTFVGVKPELWAGDKLVSYQDMDTYYPGKSDASTPPKLVQQTPKSLTSPKIIEDVGNDGVLDVVVGTDVINLCDLWIGAVVRIYAVDQKNNWRQVGGGIATDHCNWGYVEPLKKGLKYCASQSLCKVESLKQEQCVFTTNSINVPEIREPLCDGDIDVLVDKTALGSTVLIQVNGNDKGNASAPGSTTLIPLSGGVPLKVGDWVRVKQYNTSLASGWSGRITVQSQTSPDCEKRKGTPPSTPPPPIQPVCTPVLGENAKSAKLYKKQDNCYDTSFIFPSNRAYQGDINGVQGAVLKKIINTSPHRIKIVKEFNPKNPSGSLGSLCTSSGHRCNNTTVIYTIEPNGSWDNINQSCWPFYRIYACLESVTGAPFDLTVDIKYEYTCK